MRSKKVHIDDLTNIPEILYKYRTWSDPLHKEILTKQIVFMARPTSFEDTLDCKLQKRYDLLTGKDIYRKYYQTSERENPNWTKKQHEEFAKDWEKHTPMKDPEYIRQKQIEHFNDFDNKFGVFSMTANPTINEMWEKYSESHRGLCIGFNAKKLFKHIGGGGEVVYYNKLPTILPFDDFDTEHFKQVHSKEKRWSLEEEYRTFRYYKIAASNNDRKIFIPTECYTSIIFGEKQSENHRSEIIKTCKERGYNVNFYCTMLIDNKVIIKKYWC